jgi:hypothetical protein
MQRNVAFVRGRTTEYEQERMNASVCWEVALCNLVNRCQRLLPEAGGCRFFRNVGIVLIYETAWRHIPENSKSSWSQSHMTHATLTVATLTEMSHRLDLSPPIEEQK